MHTLETFGKILLWTRPLSQFSETSTKTGMWGLLHEHPVTVVEACMDIEWIVHSRSWFDVVLQTLSSQGWLCVAILGSDISITISPYFAVGPRLSTVEGIAPQHIWRLQSVGNFDGWKHGVSNHVRTC